MGKFQNKVEKGKRFVNHDIWDVDLTELSNLRAKIVKSAQVTMLTIRTFSAQKIGFQSVALSFFCTMAAIPFLSVMLAMTKGLGLSDKLDALLRANFPANPELVPYVMTYADNILLKASSSVLGFISAAFFIWLVIWMMLCVERVFNNVWKVRKGRSFATRFWRDVAILIISPLLMFMLYWSAFLLSGIMQIGHFKWLLMFASSVLVFTAMYKFIPNTKVLLINAFKAALFSGLVFTGIQFVYVESQIFLTRLSSIYGAIAAIPFFMFWLNFSWFAILVGAELSYAYQNVNKLKIKSLDELDK